MVLGKCSSCHLALAIPWDSRRSARVERRPTVRAGIPQRRRRGAPLDFIPFTLEHRRNLNQHAARTLNVVAVIHADFTVWRLFWVLHAFTLEHRRDRPYQSIEALPGASCG